MTIHMDGATLIANERNAQKALGWTAEHDDEHKDGELAEAAWCYVSVTLDPSQEAHIVADWPFDRAAWKPSDDRVRNLQRAGALIAAEIDRLQRAEPTLTDGPFIEGVDTERTE